MEYSHTQHGKIHWLVFGVAAVMAGAAWMAMGEGAPEDEALVAPILAGVIGILILLGFCFQTLTVEDDGDGLAVRYGPLPVFKRRLRYDTMKDVEEAKSAVIDGWGIHYVPGRGWTYNLWGFSCVEIRLDTGRRLRIGTDDSPGLAAFLKERIG